MMEVKGNLSRVCSMTKECDNSEELGQARRLRAGVTVSQGDMTGDAVS